MLPHWLSQFIHSDLVVDHYVILSPELYLTTSIWQTVQLLQRWNWNNFIPLLVCKWILPGNHVRKVVWHTCLHQIWQSEASGSPQSGSPPETSLQILGSDCLQLFQCGRAERQKVRTELFHHVSFWDFGFTAPSRLERAFWWVTDKRNILWYQKHTSSHCWSCITKMRSQWLTCHKTWRFCVFVFEFCKFPNVFPSLTHSCCQFLSTHLCSVWKSASQHSDMSHSTFKIQILTTLLIPEWIICLFAAALKIGGSEG